MLESYFVKPQTVDQVRASWIGEEVERYVVWMAERGYSSRCVFRRVPLVVAFGEFARARGARADEDLPAYVEDYVAERVAGYRGVRRCGNVETERQVAREVRGPIEQLLQLVVPGFLGRSRGRLPDPFADVLPGFFGYLAGERGLRPATIVQYRYHLGRFEGYLDRIGVSKLGELSPLVISASADGRLAFKDLVAEVGLGRVGLILGTEVAWLARNNADWYQLLDLCMLTGTLVADSDGIYCPGHINDRMVLGLKGAMAEYELHLIRARLGGGLRNKAQRGELELNLPVGLDRDEGGQITLCADEQVRHAIDRVFALWRGVGSARQVVICLREEEQRLPRRTVGQRRVRWAPASYGAVHDLLTNPAYAGAFVFGRSTQRRELDEHGRLRRRTVELPIEQWSVCLPEHHPGYVSWEEYLATRERLRRNVRPRGQGGGAAREGQALLQGLLRCGRCGRRMQVAYSGNNGRVPRYACVRAHHHHGAEHPCQSLGGLRLEQAVAAAFLEAVTPAGLRACTEAIGELERAHEQRLEGQRLAVERAQFEANRAQRQFDACEPENRLVGRTLERAWEQALLALEHEQRKLAELEARCPEPLTTAEREALARLARDLPRLWQAPSTTARDRKELLRTLICEVTVTVNEDPRRAELEIAWEGGARTELTVPLIRRGPERHRTAEDTVELIGQLAAHSSDQQIAAILNKQGRRTGTGLPFNQSRVKHVRQQHGIPAAPPPNPDSNLVTIQQAAAELGVSGPTVYRWLKDGFLPGEQTTPHAPWRIRLTNETRARFVPEVPEGYVALDEAAKRLGCARQTVLHKVQRGELHAVQVTQGRRKGLRIKVSSNGAGLFDQ